MKCGVRGWWGKKERKKNENVMIKTNSKNQNFVPNTIFFFFLIVISVVKLKLCTKQNKKRKHVPNNP